MMVIYFGTVPGHQLLTLGSPPSFGTLFLWAIQNGLDVYNGMVGNLLCRVRLVIPLGLGHQQTSFSTSWNALSVPRFSSCLV